MTRARLAGSTVQSLIQPCNWLGITIIDRFHCVIRSPLYCSGQCWYGKLYLLLDYSNHLHSNFDRAGLSFHLQGMYAQALTFAKVVGCFWC